MKDVRDESPAADETPEVRRPYEAPRVETVKINFDEVALAACKNIGGGGAAVSSCALGCVIDGS